MTENTTPTAAPTAEKDCCAWCGEEFVPKGGGHWSTYYCSEACGDADARDYERTERSANRAEL